MYLRVTYLHTELYMSKNAVNFRDKLLQIFAQFNLNPKLIRGQAMDGCSTMSGVHGGLQALFAKLVHLRCMYTPRSRCITYKTVE